MTLWSCYISWSQSNLRVINWSILKFFILRPLIPWVGGSLEGLRRKLRRKREALCLMSASLNPNTVIDHCSDSEWFSNIISLMQAFPKCLHFYHVNVTAGKQGSRIWNHLINKTFISTSPLTIYKTVAHLPFQRRLHKMDGCQKSVLW